MYNRTVLGQKLVLKLLMKVQVKVILIRNQSIVKKKSRIEKAAAWQ
jgi:hypothetical protein